MNYEKSTYDLTRFWRSDEFKTITDTANAVFNEAKWRMFASWGMSRATNKWTNIVKNDEINVAATVLSVSGEKPLRGTSGYSEYGGTLPKIGHGFAYGEDDFIRLKEYRAQGIGDDLIQMDYMSRYSANIGGMHNRINMFVFSGLSRGEIIVDANNNPDGVKTSFDMKFPASHKLKAKTKKWAEDGSDPIGDLQRMQQLMIDEGRPYTSFIMPKSLFTIFCNNKKVQADVIAKLKITITGYPLTQSEIKATVETGFDLPPIMVINEKSALEIDGIPQSLEGSFDPNTVCLLTPQNFFELVTFDSLYLEDKNSVAVIGSTESNHFASMLRYQSEPMKTITTLESWVIPAPRNPKNIVILDTSKVG